MKLAMPTQKDPVVIFLHQKFATLTPKALVVIFNRSERGEVLKLLRFTKRDVIPIGNIVNTYV